MCLSYKTTANAKNTRGQLGNDLRYQFDAGVLGVTPAVRTFQVSSNLRKGSNSGTRLKPRSLVPYSKIKGTLPGAGLSSNDDMSLGRTGSFAVVVADVFDFTVVSVVAAEATGGVLSNKSRTCKVKLHKY